MWNLPALLMLIPSPFRFVEPRLKIFRQMKTFRWSLHFQDCSWTYPVDAGSATITLILHLSSTLWGKALILKLWPLLQERAAATSPGSWCAPLTTDRCHESKNHSPWEVSSSLEKDRPGLSACPSSFSFPPPLAEQPTQTWTASQSTHSNAFFFKPRS